MPTVRSPNQGNPTRAPAQSSQPIRATAGLQEHCSMHSVERLASRFIQRVSEALSREICGRDKRCV